MTSNVFRPFPGPSRSVIYQDTVGLWPLNMKDKAKFLDEVLFNEHLLSAISVYLTKREVTMVCVPQMASA